MVYSNGKLNSEQVLIDNIPGSSNHNGGRIKFGPDKALYITTSNRDGRGDPVEADDRVVRLDLLKLPPQEQR